MAEEQFRNKRRLFLLRNIKAAARWLEFFVEDEERRRYAPVIVEERIAYWKGVLQFWEGKYYNEMKSWGGGGK